MCKQMVAYTVETFDGRVHRGAIAVHAQTADDACRIVRGLIRGHSIKYGGRPDCFDFDPSEVDDVSVNCLGLA